MENRAVGFAGGARTWTSVLVLSLLLVLGVRPGPLPGQTIVPGDQFHVSLTLGGYIMVGVGFTHWMEQHHALELTLFPFAYPGEGFPFGIRAGYAWTPSDEVWRAKLGGNVTMLIRPAETGGDRFVPILALTPGVQYHPTRDRLFRADLWMSYYLSQRVFAPTAIELLHGWQK